MVVVAAKRNPEYYAVLLFCIVVCISSAGCGKEARARRGLKKAVHENIEQWNKYYQQEVKPNVYQSAGQFYKVFKERVDPEVEMRSTNSAVTPFVASIGFTENTYLTGLHSSYAGARDDPHFSLSKSKQGEVIYTFVGGAWKKKEIY